MAEASSSAAPAGSSKPPVIEKPPNPVFKMMGMFLFPGFEMQMMLMLITYRSAEYAFQITLS
jgi:hypothetical protein